MKRALIVVDVQHDFLPGGALAVPQGDDVIETIRRIAGSKIYDTVLATQDWHPANHCSFDEHPLFEDGSWPAHCVAGTEGAEIHPRIREVVKGTFRKGFDAEREAYSGFEAAGLDAALRTVGIETVDVVGLAEDFCVKATALDAARLGFQTNVILGATRAVTETGEQDAEGELIAAGVELIYPCIVCKDALAIRCCEFGADR